MICIKREARTASAVGTRALVFEEYHLQVSEITQKSIALWKLLRIHVVKMKMPAKK